MLRFAEKTITVTIDTAACETCATKACVDACAVFSRGILRLREGLPSVGHLTADEVARRGTECLACEHACRTRGNAALSIEVPVEGLDDYLAAQRRAPAPQPAGRGEVSDGDPD